MRKYQNILDKINNLECVVIQQYRTCYLSLDKRINDLEVRNKQLINIIESLVNDKFTTKDFEAVMIKPYRGRPILIKDGERIDNENMSSIDINWTWDSKVEINVSNE